MGKSLRSDEAIREYLLGRVSDETVLEGIEDMLFTDEEFCSQVALAEDVLINDYVFNRLNGRDAESFRATLESNRERCFKLDLTQALREKALLLQAIAPETRPSLFSSIRAFISQPKYAGAFAVLLIAAVGLTLYLRLGSSDQLAELRSMYQRERPVETRISTFAYAPRQQLRGAPEPDELRRLRRIENILIAAVEEKPGANTHHALGIFFLTQHKYEDAIKEFENAIRFDDGIAKIHNDLGSAHFEIAKTGATERKFDELARSLEQFTKATELDGNLLEALFNKSLALQELRMPRQAKESWTLYLEKDPSSPWAEEARKNLTRIESGQSLFRTDEQVLTDFLTAFRNHDAAFAQQIHNDTKGLLRGTAVPLQLTRRCLLAMKRGDDAERNESIDALRLIGGFEQNQNNDQFFVELASFYANASPEKTEPLLRARSTLDDGVQSVYGRGDYAAAIRQFEESRNQFARLGNICEAAIAESWVAQCLPNAARIDEGRRRLAAQIAMAQSNKFIFLLPPAYYWLGVSDDLQDEFSQSNKNYRTAMRLAEASNNRLELEHAQETLVKNYLTLGELELALSYASKMFSGKALYYESRRQWLRNAGTLIDLLLSLGLPSTSLSLATEKLSVTLEDAPSGRRVNDSLRYMILAAIAKKDFAAALKYAEDSMQIALKEIDNPQNTKTKCFLYGLAGDVKSETKDYRAAVADYDRALDLYNRIPELSVGLYQIHKGRLFCLQELNDEAGFASELHTVLALSEEYRRKIREDESRQAFFANERSVFDAAIEGALRHNDTRGAFAFAEASKARSLLEFVQSKKSMAEVEDDFASVAHPLSLEEIQSRLPDQVQLVQYAALPGRLVIWVLTRAGFDLIEKQITAAELESKIIAYQQLILKKAAYAEIRKTGNELYDLLIPADLPRDKQVCLIPDKALHQLSFAALISPGGNYLLEQYSLFYAPSASVLVFATENARRKELVRNESLLSIGNPEFDREENPKLADLPDAEVEARSVARDYRKSSELLRAAATKESFLKNFTSPEVIHFAGHFVANGKFPGNSKLLFAGGDLRTSELGAYKLPKAKLVVLSACQTAFERYDKSEGAIGIARTLLAMGAPLVVATEWKVDSAATTDVMIGFHHNRKQRGLSSIESLRQAQLAMLGAEQTSAPFNWAAFSLFGGYANY